MLDELEEKDPGKDELKRVHGEVRLQVLHTNTPVQKSPPLKIFPLM